MSQTITIDPVTRLEGHGKITIQLNGKGEVEDAHFHVTQVRGFERFSEGRPFYEMPSLMARICGICPVSHLLASAKACEAIMSVQIPHTAAQLRRMLNLAQMVQSHALSFFHLSSPDLLLGMDSDPATRHILGVAAANPKLGLRRHRPAPLRAEHHRAAGRQARPSRMGCAGRRDRAAGRRQARQDSGHDSRGLRQCWPGAGRIQANCGQVQSGDRGLRKLPVKLPGPGQRGRVLRDHRRRIAADRRPGQDDRGRHDRQPLHRGDRRGCRALQLHEVRLLQAARAIPRAATAWGRWRGSTS